MSTIIPTSFAIMSPSIDQASVARFTIDPSVFNRSHMSDSKDWIQFVDSNQTDDYTIAVFWLSNEDELLTTIITEKIRLLSVSNRYMFVRKYERTMSHPYSECDPSITSLTSRITRCLRSSRSSSGYLVRFSRKMVSKMPGYVVNETVNQLCTRKFLIGRAPCQSESYEPIEIPIKSNFISYGPTILEFRSWTEPKSDLIELFIEICSVLGMWFGFSLLGIFQYGQFFMTNCRQWLRCDQSWECPRIEFGLMNVFSNRMKVVKFTEN